MHAAALGQLGPPTWLLDFACLLVCLLVWLFVCLFVCLLVC